MPKTDPRSGRALRNRRSTGSAAAYAGCIGIPDPSYSSRGEGSLRAFCSVFNERADAWLSERSPECRSFARAEREARAISP